MGEAVVDGSPELLGDARGGIQKLLEGVPDSGWVGIGLHADVDFAGAHRFGVLVLFSPACSTGDRRHAGNSSDLELELARDPVGFLERSAWRCIEEEGDALDVLLGSGRAWVLKVSSNTIDCTHHLGSSGHGKKVFAV